MTGKPQDASLSWRSLLTVDLNTRSDRREILDNQESDHTLLAPTLRNLERINIFLSGIRSLCVRTIFRKPLRDRPELLTIADLGCGGGDLALWLARQCAGRGIQVRIYGIDHDPRVAKIARERCARKPCITIIHGDATDPGILSDPIDWIVSNHFLHHLDSAKVTQVLKKAVGKARRGVIMNDLIRNRLSLIAFSLLCRSIMSSGCTASDGLVSILRSFTRRELDGMLAAAGLENDVVVRRHGIGHRAVVSMRDPATLPLNSFLI
jgi:2-polyprenyl-3-methyl-5-hydroxy-6-metoxy-1,4-benzoquinol methylase